MLAHFLSSLLYVEALILHGNSYNYDDQVRCTRDPEPVNQGTFGVCTPYVINPGQPSYCDPFYTVGVDHFYLPNNRAGGSVYNLNAFIIRGKFTIDVIRQPCKYTATRVLCYYYYPPCQVINSTHFIPPPSVCTDTCNYSVDVVCLIEYQQLLAYVESIQNILEEGNLYYPNCSDISLPIRPLGQSCCSNAGAQGGVMMSLDSPEYTVYEEDQFVEICIEHTHGIIRRAIPVTLTTIMITADDELDYTGVEQTLSFGPTVRRLCFNITILDDDVYEEQSDVFRVSLSSTYPVVSYGVQNATVYIVSSDPFVEPVQPIPVVAIASSVTAGIVLLILILAIVSGIGVWLKVRQLRTPLNIVIEEPSDARLRSFKTAIPDIIITGDESFTEAPRYTEKWNVELLGNFLSAKHPRMAKVSSGFLRQMSEDKLLIPSSSIKLLDCIGQGEFGVVYRAHLSSYEGRAEPGLVAVKTLKGMHSANDLNSLVEECTKMAQFNHRNVLSLIGVCIDAGKAPYLVMPFMEMGSLLSYLRKERAQLTILGGAGDEMIIEAQRKLLSMCLQIASGMSYLVQNKFVHRDLAARNCMIDGNFVIKVADFGLSEDIYARNYFRQQEMSKDDSGEKSGVVKLPIRWMALESLHDGVFTEKTDVWAFGVTCWEVFSLGRTPYPAVDPFTLIKFLEQGKRLDKPSNAACSDEVFELIQTCWLQDPKDRPSFDYLKVSITTMLEVISGYLDFSATLTPKTMQENYDHLCPYDQLSRYDKLPEASSCNEL